MNPAAPVTTIKLDSRSREPVCCRAVKHAATEDELGSFRRDGYFVRESVFDVHDVAALDDETDEAFATVHRHATDRSSRQTHGGRETQLVGLGVVAVERANLAIESACHQTHDAFQRFLVVLGASEKDREVLEQLEVARSS